jgi:hypothetical protein
LKWKRLLPTVSPGHNLLFGTTIEEMSGKYPLVEAAAKFVWNKKGDGAFSDFASHHAHGKKDL